MSVRAIAAPILRSVQGPLLSIVIILSIAGGDAHGQMAPAGVLLVDGSQSPAFEDGQTWATAYRYLNDAINQAEDLDPLITEIWVRGADDSVLYSGTGAPSAAYSDFAQFPDRSFDFTMPDMDDPTLSFEIPEGLTIYGGFAGGETSRSQRDPESIRSVLSGAITASPGPGISANSDTVVRGGVGTLGQPGGDVPATINGVTVEYGVADTTILNPFLILQSAGAALVPDGRTAGVRSIFRDNRALAGGVTLYRPGTGAAPNGTLQFVNSMFFDNTATGEVVFGSEVLARGGGVLAVQKTAVGDPAEFLNCLMVGNTAGTDGGVLSIREQGSVVVTHCTAVGNTATGIGGFASMVNVSTMDPQLEVTSSILRENYAGPGGGMHEFVDEIDAPADDSVAINYSNVQSQNTSLGTGNIDAVEVFVDDVARDFRLTETSQSIDAGLLLVAGALPDVFDADDDGDVSEFTPDLALRDRQLSKYVGAERADMGAYEFCLKDRSDITGDEVVGFDDLVQLLADWGPCPVGPPCASDLDASGSVGFDDLVQLLADWGWCVDDPEMNSPPDSVGDCIEKVGTSDPQKLAACIEAMMRVESGQ